jgi:hypothetical protein
MSMSRTLRPVTVGARLVFGQLEEVEQPVEVGRLRRTTEESGKSGRVGALFFAADSLALLIGALAAPALTLAVDLPLVLNLPACFAALAAALTLIVVPRHPADFLPVREWSNANG